MDQWISNLVTFGTTIIAVALASVFASRQYFRQREHELVLARYLDGGVDDLAADLERVSAIYQHNWARCLALIKNYRDMGGDFDVSQLSHGFIELQSSHLRVAAHHRVYRLTGFHSYWVGYQMATAFYTSANSLLVSEVPESLRVHFKDGPVALALSHKEAAEFAFEEIQKPQKEHLEHVKLIEQLQVLSDALESERPTFSALQRFSENTKVAESVAVVEKLYPDASDDD